MALAVNIDIARTHLLAKKRQTLVAMLGVTFGIGMYLLMISFMTGFNEYLEDSLLSSTPDIRLYNDIKTDYSHSILDEVTDTLHALNIVHHPKPKEINNNLKNAKAIEANIATLSGIGTVSPQLSTQVFYNNGPVQINGSLLGVNIMEEAKISGLDSKMKTGALEHLLSIDNGILLGHGLATKLNVGVGDVVTLASPKGVAINFRVVGTFQFGIGALDNVRSYVSIKNVQKLLGKDNQYISEISVKLKDYTQAKSIAALMASKYKYKADDWETANASATISITIRNVMTIVISIALLIVAGFGIYNIMNMTIQNKLKDIAILKAEGFSANDILQIFLFQSLTIGFLGSVVGLVFGFFMSYGVYSLPFPKNDLITLTHYPVVFHTRHYVFGIMFGLITTLLAGYFPSRKAGRIDPVEILRG